MKATTRLTISLVLAAGCHAALLIRPSMFSKKAPETAKSEMQQTPERKIAPQIRPKPEKNEERIAARVTNTQDSLEMNGGQPEPSVQKDVIKEEVEPIEKQVVTTPQEEIKKEQKVVSKEESLKQEIEKASETSKEIIKSRLTAQEYTRYLKSLNVGRVKGVPTPTLILAHYDLDEILAVHNYFGLQVIALDTQKVQQVIKIKTAGTATQSLTVTKEFNWKGYSNRIFPRTEPYFKQYTQQAQSLLRTADVRLMTIVPAGADSYFRFKTLKVLEDASLDKKAVATVISRFHKTAFGAWVLIIEKAQLHNGSFVQLQDFELTKLKRG